MEQECSTSSLSFAKVSRRQVVADFEGGHISSDGGVMFLRAVEQRIGLVDRLAAVLPDRRHPSYVKHSLKQQLTQRVFQIACGYEDCNDANTLRSDPLFMIGCDQAPVSGDHLASQPTLSRLENSVRRSDLMRMAYALGEAFIASFPRPPRRVIIDIDDTADLVHGGQQLSLFNGFHGNHCFQPLHLYDGITGRLITAVLRPGKTPASGEIVAILRRVIGRLQKAWPRVRLVVRGDSHFARPQLYQLCQTRNVDYIINLGTHGKLRENVASLRQKVDDRFQRQKRKQIVRRYTEFLYQAQSWPQPHRVIAKVERSEKGPNTRFVITSLSHKRPAYLYRQLYAKRGQAENYIKNHKTYLHSDRTSCHRFQANQFRLMLHSAAYMLLHALRDLALTATQFHAANFDTIQKHLLKVATRVRQWKTKIELHFPSSFPLRTLYTIMNRRLQQDHQ